MNEFELLIDLHRFNERQGPGSQEDTLRALQFCDLPNRDVLRIADIGSGTGAQTLTLAQHLKGKITAIDLFDEFLSELEKRKSHQPLGCEIEVLQASMDELPFEAESLDLIWSEGAIYNMGFERGLRQWQQFLKPGGCLCVSEITWITQSRPAEIENFWMSEYPEIGTASKKIQQLEENGYSLAGYFILDQTSWIENYYKPLADGFNSFLNRNNNSETAQEIVKENQREMELYMKFKEFYSYGFYIARKEA
jgi:ubiquinone/menaquinone biosynthesis C-methylase UbiE